MPSALWISLMVFVVFLFWAIGAFGSYLILRYFDCFFTHKRPRFNEALNIALTILWPAAAIVIIFLFGLMVLLGVTLVHWVYKDIDDHEL